MTEINIGGQWSNIIVKLDEEDISRVLQQTWQVIEGAIIAKINGKSTSLAKFIMPETELEIDHKNCDYFNNQKSNLRVATHHQNMMNRGIPENNTSGFKGVVRHKRAKKYQAQIMFKKENIYLGLHKTKIDAAMAYDRKAIELFGEFASLNFPREQYV